jgi:lipopolysaccharide transport system ATP-binding protein
VLVVDEVLAVGDAAFQRKCLGRMESIAESGRTVLFVSHNLAAVRTLCASLLLLEKGRVVFRGSVEEGLALYESGLTSGGGELEPAAFAGPLGAELKIERLRVVQAGSDVAMVDPRLPLELRLEGRADQDFRSVDVAIALSRDGYHLFTCHDGPTGQPLPSGGFVSRFELPADLLRPGTYTIGAGGHRPGQGGWMWAADVARLSVSDRGADAIDGRELGALTVRYSGRRESLSRGHRSASRE